MSYRDISEILLERGVTVHHTTIYRWVQKYAKILYSEWEKKKYSVSDSWRMDETYIKFKGQWKYLYRAIDKNGFTFDILLRKKRDTKSAYAFLKRLHKHYGSPRAIVTDHAPATQCALRLLKQNGFYKGTEHRTNKYLNNRIEQDHRFVKRGNRTYQSLRTASATLKGIEVIHALHKESRRENSLFCFSPYAEVAHLLKNVA